jgi:hypothetical protein
MASDLTTCPRGSNSSKQFVFQQLIEMWCASSIWNASLMITVMPAAEQACHPAMTPFHGLDLIS